MCATTLTSGDTKKIRHTDVTDNVVDLLSKRIHRNAGESQGLLKIAACIGNQFTLALLAKVTEQTEQNAAVKLWESLVAGFVHPLDENYKAAESYDAVLENIEISYRFAHDRVQQAVYALLDENEKQQTHLKLARELHQQFQTKPDKVPLYDLTDHYNKALDLIATDQERCIVKELNILAADKAKQAVAFSIAAQLLQNAAKLIGQNGFNSDYRETMDVHLNLAECHYVLGDYARAEEQYTIIQTCARNDADLDRLYDIQLRQTSQQGQNKQTLEQGAKVLEQYGVKFIAEPHLLQVAPTLVKSKWMLKGKDIAALVDAPEMKDENAINTLLNISATAYVYDANTMLLLVNKMTQLSIKYGNAPSSAFGYGLFGFIEGAALRNFKNSRAFSELSMQLANDIEDPIIVGKVKFLKCFANQHWYEPVGDCFDLLQDAYKTLYNNGSYVFAAYSLFTMTMKQLYAGLPLEKVYSDAVEYSNFANQISEDYSTNLLAVLRRFMSGVSGHYDAGYEGIDKNLIESNYTKELKDRRFVMALAWHYVYNQALSYLFGDTEAAYRYLQKAKMVDIGAPTTMAQIEHHFYNVLILSDRYAQGRGIKHAPTRLKIVRSLRLLKLWAKTQPENFNSRYLIAKGKWLSVIKPQLADAIFDQGFAAAKQTNSLALQAIGAELRGTHAIQLGNEKLGKTQLSLAVHTWRRWGALKKADQLANLHATLLDSHTALSNIKVHT